MKFERIELHNHTNESDGQLRYTDLLDFYEGLGVKAFAITDHNTLSAHPKLRAELEKRGSDTRIAYGMELTTYFGHIVMHNLPNYVDWSDIDRKHPEYLFRRAHDMGAVAGVAHPFCLGHPLANGCRWEMELGRPEEADFIEVVNTAQDFVTVNRLAIDWWEKLLMQGYRLAATSGHDLHRWRDLTGQFTTYIETEPGEDIGRALDRAIRTRRTIVTRGCAVNSIYNEENGIITLEQVAGEAGRNMTVRVKSNSGEWVYSWPDTAEKLTMPYSAQPEDKAVIAYICDGSGKDDELVCIAPPVFPGV